MKKFLAVCAALLFHCVASAQSLPPPSIAARSWLLLDASSNQILGSQEPDMRIEPASLTKIMTLYLLFERLEAGDRMQGQARQIPAQADAAALGLQMLIVDAVPAFAVVALPSIGELWSTPVYATEEKRKF